MEIANETDDLLVLDLIEEACLAARYRELAREFPDASGGLLRMAAKFSASVGALADEVAFRGAGRFIELAFEIGERDADTHAASRPVPGMPRR